MGNLSLEHITSAWMNELFLGENKHTRAHKGKKTQWTTTDGVNWKARVVCKECNNGWMSDLESKHAKPVLTPLITGEVLGIPITQQEARSIALWIFKTAVIIDEASHRKTPLVCSAHQGLVATSWHYARVGTHVDLRSGWTARSNQFSVNLQYR